MNESLVLDAILEDIKIFYFNNDNQPAKYILLSNNFFDKLKSEVLDINSKFKDYKLIKNKEKFEIMIDGIKCLKVSNVKDLLEIV